MTPERIEEIKRLHAAASPGPWKSKNESVYAEDLLDPVCQLYGNSETDFENAQDNASFIAAAITLVPELLAALEEAQKATDHERNRKYVRMMERDNARKELAEAQQTIARQREAFNSAKLELMKDMDGQYYRGFVASLKFFGNPFEEDGEGDKES